MFRELSESLQSAVKFMNIKMDRHRWALLTNEFMPAKHERRGKTQRIILFLRKN